MELLFCGIFRTSGLGAAAGAMIFDTVGRIMIYYYYYAHSEDAGLDIVTDTFTFDTVCFVFA